METRPTSEIFSCGPHKPQEWPEIAESFRVETGNAALPLRGALQLAEVIEALPYTVLGSYAVAHQRERGIASEA